MSSIANSKLGFIWFTFLRSLAYPRFEDRMRRDS
jgi:hypothetical protein